ncbi:hypothetical protein Tco_1073494 [Tanacetum coccineum]
MIPRTDMHCFDVHNDGYFAHLPLSYINGVILNMVVLRMPYEKFAEYLEEKCGNYFQGLYYQVPNIELERGLVRYLSQAITNEMDACVSKTIGPLKKRYCNDFSMDEMVDWAEMEVEQHARTNTIDKGKKKVSQDETEGVEAWTSIVDSEFDSDDDSEYDSDKSVDYLSPGKKELIGLRNRIKTNREAKAKPKGNPVLEMNEPNDENSMLVDNVGETYVTVEQFKECLTYYALANGFSLWYERSSRKKVVAKCGQRPPRLYVPEKEYEKTVGEHYVMLRSYEKAILDTNPGSTVKLRVTVNPNNKTYFDRFYVCFAGLADGWKTG